MLRYQLFLSIGIVFLSIWKALLVNLDSIKNYSSAPSSTIDIIVNTFLPIAPILLLAFYALFSVLYKVATFEDCPDAADELSRQINGAKSKLKAAGYAF